MTQDRHEGRRLLYIFLIYFLTCTLKEKKYKRMEPSVLTCYNIRYNIYITNITLDKNFTSIRNKYISHKKLNNRKKKKGNKPS